MRSDYRMHRSQFCQYMEFRHAMAPYLRALQELPEFSPLEGKLQMGDLGSQKIMKISVPEHKQFPHTVSIKAAWKVGIDNLDNDDRMEALGAPWVAAIPARIRLIQLKYLHRAYFTRSCL